MGFPSLEICRPWLDTFLRSLFHLDLLRTCPTPIPPAELCVPAPPDPGKSFFSLASHPLRQIHFPVLRGTIPSTILHKELFSRVFSCSPVFIWSTPRVTDGPAPNCSKIMGLKLKFQVLHLGICFSNMELGTSEMWNFQKFGNFGTGSSRVIMKLFEVVLFGFFCHFCPFRVTLRPLLLLTPLAPWLPQAMAPTTRSCCPTPPSWPG